MKSILLALLLMVFCFPSVMALELIDQPQDMTIPSNADIVLHIDDHISESDWYYNKLYFTYNETEYEFNRTNQYQPLGEGLEFEFYGIDAFLGGEGLEYNLTDMYFYASDGVDNITTQMFDIYFRYIPPIKEFDFADFNLSVGEFDNFRYYDVFTYYDIASITFTVDNVTYTVDADNGYIETETVTIKEISEIVFIVGNNAGTVDDVEVCANGTYGQSCTAPFTINIRSPSEDFKIEFTLPTMLMFIVMLVLGILISLGLFGDDMRGFGGFMVTVEGLILLFSSFSAILSMFLIGIGIMFIVRK